jgi:hypothetical protein
MSRSVWMVVVLGWASVVVCSAQSEGRQRVRPIEFSPARSDEVTTNLHQLTSRKDGLKQLEEDLYAPLHSSFTPRSSLEGVMVPPARPPAQSAVQSKRAKELLERRKNWMFMTPEDLLAAPTIDQILTMPERGADGLEKKDLPPMEKYYQSLIPKRHAKPNPAEDGQDDLFGGARKSSSPDKTAAGEEPDLPGGLKESAQTLKMLFESPDNPSPFSEAARASSLSDPFGLGVKPASHEQVTEHKKFMEQYHMLVDPTWHPPTVQSLVPGLPTLPDASQPAEKPVALSPGLPSTSSFKALEAQADVVAPVLGPRPLPDVNALAVGQTRPSSTLSKVEVPRGVPPAPDFTAPRRAF